MHNIDITILGEQALAALMQRLSEARGKHAGSTLFSRRANTMRSALSERSTVSLYTPLSTKPRSVSATKPSM